jgi:putative hydrolase of HD superfamily
LIDAKSPTDIAKYLYEMGYLKQLKRSGWGMLGIPQPESVAEHSFRTAILGYILASLEGANPYRTAVICLFHDTAEARITDLHRVARRYLHVVDQETQALSDQVQRLPHDIAKQIEMLTGEYERIDTPEGRIAHEADVLECLIQGREYQVQGFAAADDWITGCYAALQTESAKHIADAVIQTEPHEWWKGLKVPR